MFLGLPSERKEVAQPAPDLQTFMGRGQVEEDGLPLLLALSLLEAEPLAFPVVSCDGKDFFPLEQGAFLLSRPSWGLEERKKKELWGGRGKTDKTRT
jgi:hypothetical protein